VLLGQVRLDAFPAGQRLHNPLIRPGLILLGLLDADVSGRDFPRGKGGSGVSLLLWSVPSGGSHLAPAADDG
jgi:hypothetical protein